MSGIVDHDIVQADEAVGYREGSLEDLYVRSAPGAVRLAFLLTSDPALAEDIAQDAFIKVAGRFHHLRSPGSFDAYLRKTVVNLCMSQHRRRRVERAYLAREGSRPPARAEQPAEPHSCAAFHPVVRWKRGRSKHNSRAPWPKPPCQGG